MKKRSSDPTAPVAESMTGTPGKAVGLGGAIALFASGLVLGFGSGTFLALDLPPWLDLSRPGTTNCPSCSCAAAEQSSLGDACEPALAKLRADFEEFQQKGLADLTAKLKEDAKRQAKKGKKQKRQKAQAQPTTATRTRKSAKDAAREAALSGKDPPTGKQQKAKAGAAKKPKAKKKVRRKQKKGGMTRASVVAASKQLYKKRRAASRAAAQEAEPSTADSAMGEEARKIVSFEKTQEDLGKEPEEEARADITEACSQNNLSKNKLQEALQESASVRRELEHLDIIASYEEATR